MPGVLPAKGELFGYINICISGGSIFVEVIISGFSDVVKLYVNFALDKPAILAISPGYNSYISNSTKPLRFVILDTIYSPIYYLY